MKLHILVLLGLLLSSVQGVPASSVSSFNNQRNEKETEIIALSRGFSDWVKDKAVCNAASKAAFGNAFAAAVKASAWGCQSMTPAEWQKVGCSSPARHRSTKLCVPANWGGVLKNIIKADAMALKTKVLFKKGMTRFDLFNTSKGRALLRHELAHIRQQDGVSAYRWGYRYLDAYCDAGRSYEDNKYEVEARTFQNDSC